MARYYDTEADLRFVALDLSEQLRPGTFEHALNYLIDHELDLGSGFLLRSTSPPCVRIVVASNEAEKDESKIQSIVQRTSGRKGPEPFRWHDVGGDHGVVGDRSIYAAQVDGEIEKSGIRIGYRT
jgi:hypothetical protein